MPRIQVNMSEDMLERLAVYSEKIGIPRSSMCATFIGQAVYSLDIATESLKNLGEDAVNQALRNALGGIQEANDMKPRKKK